MSASGRESRIRHPPFLSHYKSSATVFQSILGLWPTRLSVAYTMNTAWQRRLPEFLRTTPRGSRTGNVRDTESSAPIDAQAAREGLHPPAGPHSRLWLLLRPTPCIPAVVGHAPCPAARTKTVPFAAEGNQVFSMTAIAAYPQETVLQTTAFEVILEFPLDVARQCRALCRKIGHERGVVFCDDLVKEAALRAMVHIHARSNVRTGFPASRQRQHDRSLASSA